MRDPQQEEDLQAMLSELIEDGLVEIVGVRDGRPVYRAVQFPTPDLTVVDGGAR